MATLAREVEEERPRWDSRRMSDLPNEEPQPEQPQLNIILRPEEMIGVWVNFARVSHSEHEFTVDFVRLESDKPQGIVVSRVSVSPLFITQLIDALQANWSRYAKKALPKEVYEGESKRDESDDQAAEN